MEKNDCVVDQYGNLVGIVTEVDYNSCVMSFLTDGEVEIGGRVARVDENAVLEGDFTLMQDGRLKLSYLEDDTGLIAGDQVTTSGLGMVYPAGLLVGTVESLHTEANGQDQYAVIQPAADLDSVGTCISSKNLIPQGNRPLPRHGGCCAGGGPVPFPIKIR